MAYLEYGIVGRKDGFTIYNHMKSFNEWQDIGNPDIYAIFYPEISSGMKAFDEWRNGDVVIVEASEHTRYSIEVNYRTKPDEVLENMAKIVLGYVSASMKAHNYAIKHVYTEKPVRILVSSRNWDDGEWVGIVMWNSQHHCYVVAKGFYNKDRRTVSIQSHEKCAGDSAADISKHIYNVMHSLKGEKDKQQPKLKPVPLKRGPKQ